MALQADWLWDRKITLKKAKDMLANPDESNFLSLAAVLLARKNTPKEVFREYIKPLDFLRNWHKIKRRMRQDSWNNPRIEFWQAIYETLREKYEKKGIAIPKKGPLLKPRDEFSALIAEKIKFARKQKNLTQKALAKKLKISQQVISRIEKGRENISLLTLKKIAAGLGATVYLEIKTDKTPGG